MRTPGKAIAGYATLLATVTVSALAAQVSLVLNNRLNPIALTFTALGLAVGALALSVFIAMMFEISISRLSSNIPIILNNILIRTYTVAAIVWMAWFGYQSYQNIIKTSYDRGLQTEFFHFVESNGPSELLTLGTPIDLSGAAILTIVQKCGNYKADSCTKSLTSDPEYFAAEVSVQFSSAITEDQNVLLHNVWLINLGTVPVLLYPVLLWIFTARFWFRQSDRERGLNSDATSPDVLPANPGSISSCPPDSAGARNVVVSVADYLALLEHAISRLDWNHSEARGQIYERARSALRTAQFTSSRQQRKNASQLDQAIRLAELRSTKRFEPKASNTLLVATMVLCSWLWMNDVTCMSLYWIASPRKNY